MPNILYAGTEAYPKLTLLTMPPTGVCLVVAVLLTQDLTLILLTKKHKTKQKQELIYLKSKWRLIHCEEYMMCATASLIEKNICCVLLPAS